MKDISCVQSASKIDFLKLTIYSFSKSKSSHGSSQSSHWNRRKHESHVKTHPQAKVQRPYPLWMPYGTQCKWYGTHNAAWYTNWKIKDLGSYICHNIDLSNVDNPHFSKSYSFPISTLPDLDISKYFVVENVYVDYPLRGCL